VSGDPELAYRKAAAHWMCCPQCAEAGGEWASDEELCPTGRLLAQQWERAERQAADADGQGADTGGPVP